MTVLESAFPGAGATGAAMGHLVVMDDSEAQFALTAFSRRLWAERAAVASRPRSRTTPAGRCGSPRTRRRWRTSGGRPRFYEARGETAEVLDAAALREAEPQLRPGLAGALRVPGDRVLYPPAAARALCSSGARRRGAEVWTGLRVEAIEPGRVALRRAGGSRPTWS